MKVLKKWFQFSFSDFVRYAAVVAISGWGLLVFDLLLARFSPGRESVSFRQVLPLYGGYTTLLIPVATVVALLEASARYMHAKTAKRISLPTSHAILFGAASLYPFYSTGRILASGDWIGSQSYSGLIPYICMMCGGAFWVVLFKWRYASSVWFKNLFGIACVGGSGVAMLVDGVVFPSLYASFHKLVFALGGILMFMGVMALVVIMKRGGRLKVSVLGGFAILSLYSIVLFFVLSPKAEAALLAKSQTASHFLSATKVRRRPPYLGTILRRIEAGLPVIPDETALPISNTAIPRDWNIVLLVVDAMRADTLLPNRQHTPPKKHAQDGDTPFLDTLVSRMIRFKYAYSPSNGTHKSMPSIFTGFNPQTLRQKKGRPLSVLMKRTGRSAIAVVNKLFKRKKLQPLTRGFRPVSYYPDTKQLQAVEQMLTAVDNVGKRPFFAWFHFYALHNPYFSEKGAQRDGTAPFPVRYRNALKWLDGQMKTLFDGFKQRKLMEKTVFVLTADHGEGLNDHGLKTHGSYLFEEETRVPFYMLIPKKSAKTVVSTVSLLDLVPTLMDLSGKPIHAGDGRSLRPIVEDENAVWRRFYYFENTTNNHVGIVSERTKLVFYTDAARMNRFDLTSDRREKKNVFDLKGEMDQQLLSHLIYQRPDLFIDELKDGELKVVYDDLVDDLSTLSDDSARFLTRIEAYRHRIKSAGYR